MRHFTPSKFRHVLEKQHQIPSLVVYAVSKTRKCTIESSEACQVLFFTKSVRDQEVIPEADSTLEWEGQSCIHVGRWKSAIKD